MPLYNFFLTPENFDQKVKCVFFFFPISISELDYYRNTPPIYCHILSVKQSLSVGLKGSDKFVALAVLEDSRCSLKFKSVTMDSNSDLVS